MAVYVKVTGNRSTSYIAVSGGLTRRRALEVPTGPADSTIERSPVRVLTEATGRSVCGARIVSLRILYCLRYHGAVPDHLYTRLSRKVLRTLIWVYLRQREPMTLPANA